MVLRRSVIIGAIVALTLAACSDDVGHRDAAVTTSTTTAPSAPTTTRPPTSTAPSEGTGSTAVDQPLATLRKVGSEIDLEIDPSSDTAYVSNGFDLAPGAYFVPTAADFTVTAKRSGYDRPIAATLQYGTASTTLPDDAVTDWRGVNGFVEIRVERDDGTTAWTGTLPFCPADGTRQRVSPDSPVDDRFGTGCDGNPLSLGMRWTLSRGWAVPLMPASFDLPDGFAAALPSGDYRLTIGLAEPFATDLGQHDRITFPLVVDAIVPELSGVDADADGIDDSIDPFVDADRDGIEDSSDPFVDLNGDGLDDVSGATLDEVRAQTSGTTPLGEDPIADAPEDAPTHETPHGPRSKPDPQTLPDLLSLPALDIGTTTGDNGEDLLTFSAITWNRGPGPMVIDGFARTDGSPLMDAFQQFFSPSGLPISSAPVGTLEYHAGGGHDHWHFLDFSRYELISADGATVQRSGKESWCLANTDAIDLTVPGAKSGQADLALDRMCGSEGSLWIRETLAVGWGDSYSQYVSGQAFDISDLPNGTYSIRLTANPEHFIYERSETNNVSERTVVIGGVPGARTVEVPPVGLVDTESLGRSSGFGAEPKGD